MSCSKIVKIKNNIANLKDFIDCFRDVDKEILKLRVTEYFSYDEVYHYGVIIDKKMVGFLFSIKMNQLFLDKEEGLYILDFIIHPSFRSKKIATNLLDFYIQKHKETKISAHTNSLIFKKMLKKFKIKNMTQKANGSNTF